MYEEQSKTPSIAHEIMDIVFVQVVLSPEQDDGRVTGFSLGSNYGALMIGETVNTTERWLECVVDKSANAELAGYFDEIRRMTDQQAFEAMVSARLSDLKQARDNQAAVRACVWLKGQHAMGLQDHRYEKMRVGDNWVYLCPRAYDIGPPARILVFGADGVMLAEIWSHETSVDLAIQVAGTVAVRDGQ